MNFDNMLAYTEALSKNNNRTWFHDNHRDYELAQDDFVCLLDMLRFMLAKEAPELGDSLMFVTPKAFMYRIPRDMRYSKNKEPYNPSFRGYLSPMKKNFLPLSYYVHIAHDECYIGTGAWPWKPEQLNTIRDHIMRRYWELDGIVMDNGLEVYGKELKRVPRSYDPEHPAGEWLKHKYYLVEYNFTPEDMKDFETFCDAAAKAVRRFEPFRKFLSEAFTGSVPDFDEEDIY